MSLREALVARITQLNDDDALFLLFGAFVAVGTVVIGGLVLIFEVVKLLKGCPQ